MGKCLHNRGVAAMRATSSVGWCRQAHQLLGSLLQIDEPSSVRAAPTAFRRRNYIDGDMPTETQSRHGFAANKKIE